MNTQFKKSPEGFIHEKKVIIRAILIFSVFLFSLTILFYLKDYNSFFPINYLALALTLLVLLFLIVLGSYWFIKKQKMKYESYLLLLGEDDITLQENGVKQISISYNDIKSIIQCPNKSIIVNGKNNMILIPYYIEEYDSLISTLKLVSSVEITEKKKIDRSYLMYIQIIVFASLFVLFMFSENKIIVGITGVISLLVLFYSLYITIFKNNPGNNKIFSKNWGMLLLLFYIILKMYYIFV